MMLCSVSLYYVSFASKFSNFFGLFLAKNEIALTLLTFVLVSVFLSKEGTYSIMLFINVDI